MKLEALVSLSLILMLSMNSYSQASNQYGIKIGVGSSSEASNILSYDHTLSYEAELYYTIPLASFWKLRLNTGYAKRGCKSTLFVDGQNSEYKIHYHYLNFSPELLFGKQINALTPYLYMGLSGNYFLGYNFVGYYSQYRPEEELIKTYNKLHFLFNTGAGIQINNKLFIEIEYLRGLLSKTGDTFDSNSPGFYDTYIGGTIGLNIASFPKN